MTYDAFRRKGTGPERKARALQLEAQLKDRILNAELASKLADDTKTIQDHLLAARAWRRIIYPATRLDQDTTIYREAVRRHMDAATLLQRGHSAQ